jgi:hypothetical protein
MLIYEYMENKSLDTIIFGKIFFPFFLKFFGNMSFQYNIYKVKFTDIWYCRILVFLYLH